MWRYLSVFDLDHTLFTINSTHHFGLYLRRQRVISLFSLLYCLFCYYRHKLFGMSLEDLHNKVFNKVFCGVPVSLLEQHMKSFLEESFQGACYVPSVSRLNKVKEEGHYVIILSNAPEFVVAPIAQRFGVHEWRGSRYDVDDEGDLVGINGLIEGKDKAKYVIMLADHLKIPKKNISAYTDSYLDLPLLECVGTAVGVQPEKKLYKWCHQHNCEIL